MSTRGATPPAPSPSLATGGLFLTFATGASSLLRAAFLVLAGRLLGPGPYGELYTALSLIYLLGTGLTPLGSAIAHYTSLYAARGELGKVAFLRDTLPRKTLRWALVLLGLGGLAALPLREILGFGSLLLPAGVAVALALILLTSAPRGLLRGMGLFRSYGINVLVEALLRLGAAAALLLWSATAVSGLTAYALGGLGALLLGLGQAASVATDAEPVATDPRPLQRMMGPLLIFALATAAFQSLDMLFVQRFFSSMEAGLYAAAASVAKLTALAFLPFSIANLPVFTDTLARGERLGTRLLRTMGGFLLLAGSAIGALALWGTEVIRGLFGGAFVDGARWLVVLSLALTLGFLGAMVGQAFCAARRYGFLWIFGAGLLAEVIGLFFCRGSLDSVPFVLLTVQALVLLALLGMFLATESRNVPSLSG